MKTSISKKDIQLLIKEKAAFRGRFFVFKASPNPGLGARVAFGFSRKMGNAVLRNRFKRRLRVLVHFCCQQRTNCDFYCQARGVLGKISNEDWVKEKASLTQKMHGFLQSHGHSLG